MYNSVLTTIPRSTQNDESSELSEPVGVSKTFTTKIFVMLIIYIMVGISCLVLNVEATRTTAAC